MSLPEIRTGRLVLRPVVQADFPDIVRRVGDYDVAKMLTRVPHPFTLQDARDWHDGHCASRRDGERAFAIDAGDGLIGVVSVGCPAETPEFGYWLGKAFWGNGFMSEAGRAALGWMFATTETQTVMSGALNENPASLNVLSKLGFGDAGGYSLPIRSRGETLPATRMRLTRDGFRAAEG